MTAFIKRILDRNAIVWFPSQIDQRHQLNDSLAMKERKSLAPTLEDVPFGPLYEAMEKSEDHWIQGIIIKSE